MAQKLTKLEAAARLNVSQSTVDRMIQRGDLQVQKEPHGNRHRVWVLMGDDVHDMSGEEASESSADASDNSPDSSNNSSPEQGDMSELLELTALRERVTNLQELADYHRGLLKDSEWRYQQVSQQLSASQKAMETLTKALPASTGEHHAPARRSWWPFGKGRS